MVESVCQGPSRRQGEVGPKQNAPQTRSGADSSVASVPLYDLRPTGPLSQRQDADGGFGDTQVLLNQHEVLHDLIQAQLSYTPWIASSTGCPTLEVS